MTMDPLLLALDAGSQSVRALLFDPQGRVAGKGQEPVPAPDPQAALGVVEFDPLDHFRALCAATRACLAAAGVGARERVVGAALTTQRRCLVAADAEGRPLRPAMHWLDRRRARPVAPGPFTRALLGMLGDESLLPSLLALSQGNVLREADPDAWRRARWLFGLSGWLALRLTGEAVDAAGCVSGVWPFDARNGRWTTATWFAELTGCPLDKLPALRAAGEELGRLAPAAADAMGLPAGIPLYATAGDKQAEMLGTGATPSLRGVAAVSLGTGTSLLVPTREFRQSLKFRWLINPAAEPGAWALEYMVFRGYWTLSWFLRELGAEERAAAGAGAGSPEEVIGRAWEAVPPGADGLVMVPRWAPAVEHLHERGAFVGFTEVHGRAHMARALVEGIAYDLWRGAGVLRRHVGVDIRELRVAGGGSRSVAAVQMLADLFDLPAVLPDQPELSARGAAVVAAVSAGVHPDVGAAAHAMCRADRVLEPDRERGRRYREVYEKAWLPTLEALRGPSRSMAELGR